MMWPCAMTILACVALSAPTARADTELKNDSFVSGGQAAFELGFAKNEIGASRFVAPAPGLSLLRVQLLWGGNSTATRTVTLKVWDDTAGTDAPGVELTSQDFDVTGSDNAMSELTLP